MKTYITPEKMLEMTFGSEIPEIPEVVYIFFYKSMIKRIEKYFELEQIKFTRGDFYIEKNKKFGIITNFGNGESGALMLAEELSALGVKKVVAIGAVGSLADDLKIGDVVIIESAFSQSNIGTVYDYEKAEVFTSDEQNKKIESIFEKDTFKFVKTLSVPTIYRETEEEIEKAKSKNISVIEMETFALSLVFSLKNIEFSVVGCVSDVLGSDGWGFDDGFKKVFDCLENIFLKINNI